MNHSLSKTIREFAEGFEAKFKNVLLPAGRLPTQPRKKVPFRTDHFDICIPEYAFSDWDLHCYANQEKVTLFDLKSMDTFIKGFPNFQCAKTFRANNMPQFMTFMPNESFAPFADIHVECVRPEIIAQSEFGPALDEATIAWLHLTWWRKLKKGNPTAANGFRDTWIVPRWGPESYDVIAQQPTSFLTDYFAGRADYAMAVDFLLKP